MTETTETNKKLAILKDAKHYETLAIAFMKDAKLDKISEMEKKKFIALCVVNELNPFKNEVYAVPYGDKLQMTVDYRQYLERAEASGKLAGWNVKINKDGISTIIIHRHDRKIPFEYAAHIDDLKNEKNPLWNTKREAMIRKQLIKIAFANCFPENCASLDDEPEVIDSVKVEQAEIVDSVAPSIQEEKIEQAEAPKVDEISTNNELVDDINEKIQAISNDQIRIIKELGEKYFPGEDISSPETYESGNEMILKMKIEIGRKFIKDRSIMMTEDEVKNLFGGEAKEIKAIRREALKILSI